MTNDTTITLAKVHTLTRVMDTTKDKLESAKAYRATQKPGTMEHAAIAGKIRAYVEVLDQVYDLLQDLGVPRPAREEG